MNSLGRRHWWAAFAAALLVHGLTAYWATQNYAPTSAGDGSPGIAVSLSMTSLAASGASDMFVNDSGSVARPADISQAIAPTRPTAIDAPVIEPPDQETEFDIKNPVDQAAPENVTAIKTDMPLKSKDDVEAFMPLPDSLKIMTQNTKPFDSTVRPDRLQTASHQPASAPSQILSLPGIQAPPPSSRMRTTSATEPIVPPREDPLKQPPIVTEISVRRLPSPVASATASEPIAQPSAAAALSPPDLNEAPSWRPPPGPERETQQEPLALLQPDAPPRSPGPKKTAGSEAVDENHQAAEQVAAASGPLAGAGARRKGSEQGPAERGQGAGLSGEDYLALIRDWLERHKIYPRRARLRHEEGTVMVRFTLESNGRIVSHTIEKSSGSRLLDREAEDLLLRAQPLPAIPPEMAESSLQLLMPIEFSLR